jgi:methylated-DNA-[protein]-cysteine S-methyltransferase
MILSADYDSPLGRLRVIASQKGLVSVEFVAIKSKPNPPSTPLLLKAIKQLDLYFKGKLKTFDLPLDEVTTPFQSKVWKALSQIPFGKTKTYGEIAKAIQSPQAARAVGGACNQNPWIIVVPCHRVIGSNGTLLGYAGGVKTKQARLDLECQIGRGELRESNASDHL